MAKGKNNDDDAEDISASDSLSDEEEEENEEEGEEVGEETDASDFISLKLLHHEFSPMFTHQCFDDEVIHGYTPLLSSGKNEKEDVEDKEEGKLKKLSLCIDLAPSCRSCAMSIIIRGSNNNGGENGVESKMQIDTMDKNREDATKTDKKKQFTATNDKKHPREEKDDNIENGDDTAEPLKKKQKARVQFEINNEITSSTSSSQKKKEDKEEKEGENNKKKIVLNSEEIYKKISKALPPILNQIPKNTNHSDYDGNIDISPTKEQLYQVQNDYLSEPFGTILKEYRRNNETFVLSLANGTDQETSSYHSSIQKVAWFLIESASDIDVTSDEGGGFWKVLYLFRKHSSSSENETTKHFQYSLAGYTTLFHFYSPFKKPKAGIVMRICQAVVLPPYQRCGHGKSMLKTVYDVAAGVYDSILKKKNDDEYDNAMLLQEIVEVNVEDPAPAFICLRDRVDYERLRDGLDPICSKNAVDDAHVATALMIDVKRIKGDIMDPSYFTQLSEKEATLGGVRGRITPQQVHIAYELYKLDKLEEAIEEIDDEEKVEMLQKRYRLMVKKRLNKLYQEDIGLCKSKRKKQEKLAEFYDRVSDHYISVLGR